VNLLPAERDFAEVAALQSHRCAYRDALGPCPRLARALASDGRAYCDPHGAEVDGLPRPAYQPLKASRRRMPQTHPAFLK